jgi:hypothetical protein
VKVPASLIRVYLRRASMDVHASHLHLIPGSIPVGIFVKQRKDVVGFIFRLKEALNVFNKEIFSTRFCE